jgi:hypothetical protein
MLSDIQQKYELKSLNESEETSYKKNLDLFNSLQDQLLFVNNLITESEDEELEKKHFALMISNQINKLGKMIIEAFYKIKE